MSPSPAPGDGMPDRLLWSIPEALHALRIGRTKLYEEVGRGELVMVKIGRRSFVTAQSATAYVDRLTQAATAPAADRLEI